MKLRQPLLNRSAQDIIASFPPIIAIEGEQFGPHMPAILVVKPGETGYYAPPYAHGKTLAEVDALHLRVFKAEEPTPAQREAASIGSIMGWNVPGADPENYESE
jgi:hypothetical protein